MDKNTNTWWAVEEYLPAGTPLRPSGTSCRLHLSRPSTTSSFIPSFRPGACNKIRVLKEEEEQGGRRRRKEEEEEMGRGKIEIKKIENPTNRQVTYSKRRQGIMKKATELSVLCDAEVSVIMFSSTNKHAEYCTPSTDTKKVFDRYQQVTAVDLWSSQYERMQNNLSHLMEINRNLRKEIRQRMGEDLDGLEIKELRGLEQNVDEALKLVRNRKYHVITTQTETYKKKVKNSHEAHKNLLRELEMLDEHPVYGFVDGDPSNYDGALALASGSGGMYGASGYRIQQNQPNHHGAFFGGGGGPHDLRLA